MKTPSNPYLQRIASTVGTTDPLRAVEAFVSAHRSRGEALPALACKLGVSRIIEQRLPFEGGLFRLAHGELVIKLNSDRPYVRKRFTLAHEIGHLLLNTVPAFRSTPRTDRALERACDLIAAELLIPATEAMEFVLTLGDPAPESLGKIASKYSVSLHTAAIRLRDDLKVWGCCIGMWEFAPRGRTVWFVGPRRWDNVVPAAGCLELALETAHSIQTGDTWRRGSLIEPVRLSLLAKSNGRVLGLVNYVSESRGAAARDR